MSAYLFVHFKEKFTPDGEQVYFGLSKDGFHWEEVNNGNPVLWSFEGDRGVRDFTITRTKDGRFIILATDLSLTYEFTRKYKNTWDEIGKNGSKALVMWESTDLINWSEQRMLQFVDDEFGCLWAPDIIYDEEEDDYVIHWSSSHKNDGYVRKDIYYTRTKDFQKFSKPEILYKGEYACIDSALYKENGKYYLFVKGTDNPVRVLMLESDCITGPYKQMETFDECMIPQINAAYEAPTAFKTEDGKWILMLDFFGTKKEKQGYVPFISEDISTGIFTRSDQEFTFPYGYKHGTVLSITTEEYERIRNKYNSDDKVR